MDSLPFHLPPIRAVLTFLSLVLAYFMALIEERNAHSISEWKILSPARNFLNKRNPFHSVMPPIRKNRDNASWRTISIPLFPFTALVFYLLRSDDGSQSFVCAFVCFFFLFLLSTVGIEGYTFGAKSGLVGDSWGVFFT